MNWNEPWDGTLTGMPVFPAAGMLVANGNCWHILSNDAFLKPGFVRIWLDERWERIVSISGVTPLAPAPSQCADVWAALRQIAEADVLFYPYGNHPGCLRITLSDGVIYAPLPWDTGEVEIPWYELFHGDTDSQLTSKRLPEHMRDMQKFNTLLEYVGQWGA